MYTQQAKSHHIELCRWIMHGAVSSDSDHWNAPPPHTPTPTGFLGGGAACPAGYRGQSEGYRYWIP